MAYFFEPVYFVAGITTTCGGAQRPCQLEICLSSTIVLNISSEITLHFGWVKFAFLQKNCLHSFHFRILDFGRLGAITKFKKIDCNLLKI